MALNNLATKIIASINNQQPIYELFPVRGCLCSVRDILPFITFRNVNNMTLNDL